MLENKYRHRALEVDIYEQPISQAEIDLKREGLRAVYRDYLHYVLAFLVLAFGVTVRAIRLDFDHIFELVKASLNVGMWIGLFTGFMTSGNGKRRLHLIIISIVVSTAASFFASMLMTLFVGYVTAWITSINIMASALACMWILTSYDEVVIGLDSLKPISRMQKRYVDKAATYFEDLAQFENKIREQDRVPVMGEYWAIREWIDQMRNQH